MKSYIKHLANAKRQRLYCIICFYACSILYVSAQNKNNDTFWQKGAYYKMTLNNKQKILGKLESDSTNNYKFRIADSSYILVSEYDINRIVKLNSAHIKNWKIRPTNEYAHRYFLSPSAFNIKQNSIYINSTLFFYKSLEYGVYDHLSLGTGVSLYPYIVDDDEGPSINMFKFKAGGWKLYENIHAGVSGFYSRIKDNNFFSYTYTDQKVHNLSLSGLITLGNLDHNATIGLGMYQFKGNHLVNDNFFGIVEKYRSNIFSTVNLNGQTRVSRTLYLITENWLVNDDFFGNKYSFGIRYANDRFLVEALLIRSSFGPKSYLFMYDTFELLPGLTFSGRF